VDAAKQQQQRDDQRRPFTPGPELTTKVQYPFLDAEVISPGMGTLDHCLSKSLR